MSWRVKFLLNLVMVFFFVCDASSENQLFSPSILWETNERSGLGQNPASNVLEKIIPVPLNPDNEKDGYFDLYYYVEKAPSTGIVSSTRRKTILFCAGGPGELAWLGGSEVSSFLQKNEYDVVYFDLRGVGLSQIPPSNQYDRFLRTSFAVKDIEEIRRDLLGKDNDGKDRKWDAIIGYSYGTVLAQQYANQYPNNVEKLILVAPLSRHGFRYSTDAYDKFAKDFQRIHRESLEKIYSLEELGVDPGDRTEILEALFGGANQRGIYQRTEDEFGSLQFVIDDYCRLKNELKESNLDYSRNFFQKLRQLRFVGWSTSKKEDQLEIAYALKREVLDRQKAKDSCSDRHSQRSHRVFDVIGTYDGINARFLREWLAEGKKNFRRALRKSAGEAHVHSQGSINTHIEKIGMNDDPIKIEPWDPATYKHSVPTLILKGGADPVTADRQAEYTYSKALSGTRTLIESPASGHELVFPDFDDSAKKALKEDGAIMSGTLHLNPVEIPAGEKRLVTGKINGRKLNDKLRITLPQTEQGLNVVGLGVFLVSTDKRKDNVFVQIENTGDRDVPAATKIWTVHADMFSGLVSFSLPKIPKGQRVMATGTLLTGERRKERQIILEPPAKLDPQLRGLCFKIDQSKQAIILFENISEEDPFDGKPKRWAVSVDGSETTFTVDPPEIPKGHAVPWGSNVPGVDFDVSYQYQIKPPLEGESGLQGVCVPDQTRENAGSIPNEISIFMWNRNEDRDAKVKNEDGEWEITNKFFTLYAKVAPLTIPPGAARESKARIIGFEWNKWVDFKPAKGLEVAGFNILSEDEILVLIWNRGQTTINAADRDWTYVLVNENDDVQRACDSSYGAPDYLRDCLIYSFLVTSPTEFDKAEIFDVIASYIKISDPSHPQKLLEITKQHCPGGDCDVTMMTQ
jgi:pimeloyl-ACP methyl ester carboxylesterase